MGFQVLPCLSADGRVSVVLKKGPCDGRSIYLPSAARPPSSPPSSRFTHLLKPGLWALPCPPLSPPMSSLCALICPQHLLGQAQLVSCLAGGLSLILLRQHLPKACGSLACGTQEGVRSGVGCGGWAVSVLAREGCRPPERVTCAGPEKRGWREPVGTCLTLQQPEMA